MNRGTWLGAVIRRLAQFVIILLLGGLLGATLVRLAPGFGVDERELDPRLRAQTIERIRQERAAESSIVTYYFQYLGGLLRGDLGVSRAWNRPVSGLFAERIPVTARNVAFGLAGGWGLALLLTLLVSVFPSRLLNLTGEASSGLLLSVPSAVMALLVLLAGGQAGWALVLVVFPRVFRYLRTLMDEVSLRPHVLLARAKGITELRTFLWHILPAAAPEIITLAGLTVSQTLLASIPIEVICDSPGIGQLAWHAALGRDLPLLMNITLLVTAVTLIANTISDIAVASQQTSAEGAA